MARRNRGGIASFFDGFSQGYETVNRVMRDKDLADIEREKETTQFSEDQGQQLQAIADSGQYDIGIKTKEDGTFDSYTITPKTIAERGISGVAPEQAAASDASRMTGGFQPEITKYLGNEYKGGLSQTQKDRAKLIAQSGVLSKYGDPMEAQKLRQQAAQSEQMEKQGVLTDLQIGRAKREEDTASKLGEVNDAVASYMKNRVKLGEDGQPMPLTDEDFVMAGKQRVFELANRGLFDQAGAAAKESMDYATKKIQAETVERQAAVRDAVARIAQGDFASAMSVFNKYVPDGNIVQNVIQNKDGSLTLERVSGVDGSKLPPARVESMDKLIASVQTLADPNALTQYVERTFRNDIETRRLKLAENADRRAGAQAAQANTDRTEAQKEKQAKADAAVAIAEERAKAQGKTLSDAERNAIRTGILEAVPKEGGITSDYKPDSFGTGGTAIQKDKNGNIVVTKIDGKGAPGKPIVIAPPGQSSAPAMTFASVAEGEAAAKAGKIKPGDRVTIGGRTAIWMPEEVTPAAKAPPPSQSPAPVQQAAPRPQAAPQSATQAPPPAQSAPPSVASLLGADSNTPIGVIMANKAQAVEAAASELKTARSQFAAVARSGDQAAMADYQRRLASAQQRLNAVLGTMNEAQATQVRRALGV